MSRQHPSRRGPGPQRPSETDLRLVRRARAVAIVLIVAMLGWMGLQVLGDRLGLPVAMAFVFDAVALAAFLWALVATYQIWRMRRDS